MDPAGLHLRLAHWEIGKLEHRTRKILAFSLVPFLVVALAFGSYLSVALANPFALNLSHCSVSFPDGLRSQTYNQSGPNLVSSALVLLLPVDATGEVCVTYTDLFAVGPSYGSNVIPFTTQAVSVNETPGGGFSYTASPYVTIAANPTFATAQNSNAPKNVSVVYSISSDVPQAKGFYNLEIVGCAFTPLSVGYGVGEVNASDVPFAFILLHCPASPYNGAIITGLAGNMSYTYVQESASP
jgi:hypothetical protein